MKNWKSNRLWKQPHDECKQAIGAGKRSILLGELTENVVTLGRGDYGIVRGPGEAQHFHYSFCV